MSTTTIEAHYVPELPEPDTGQALTVRGQNEAVGILRPADSLDRIAEAFKEYQQVCERILTGDDYQAYEGKPRKKKSAWRKLATAFNVSTTVVKEEIERDDNRRILSASFTICAYTGPKDKPYRQFEAVGYCDINEKCCASSRGEDCHKRSWKGHFCCREGCDGRKHWTHPDHDVRSTAQTRASNRAIADLIGCGEVSAEELSDDGTNPQKPQNQAKQAAGGGKNAVKPSQTHFDRPGGMSTPPQSKAPQAAGKAAALAPSPKTITPQQAIFADSQTRDRMIAMFSEALPLLHEFFVKCGAILETEKLEDLPLRYVPVTRRQAKQLEAALADFGNGAEATMPYPANPEPEPAKPPPQPAKPPPELLPRPAGVTRHQEASPASPSAEAEKARDPEWFWKVIITVPWKGMKKSQYDKKPDTIRSLYNAMKEGDKEAQSRLWGLVHHWDCQPREFNGKTYPPTDGDRVCREALDAFADYEEKYHSDQKEFDTAE